MSVSWEDLDFIQFTLYPRQGCLKDTFLSDIARKRAEKDWYGACVADIARNTGTIPKKRAPKTRGRTTFQ